MAEARRRRSVRVGAEVGLPLAAGVALAALLFRLFPAAEAGLRGVPPAAVAGLCWAGQLWYVGYGLDPRRPTGAFWRRLLGLANAVTLARGALYAVVAGFVAAPLVAVLWGLLPPWYLALSAARYVFRGAVWLRRVRGLRVGNLPDSDLGKYLAGVQMTFVTVALLPPVPTAVVWTLAPVVLAPSLAVFTRDYLAVSGRLPGRR